MIIYLLIKPASPEAFTTCNGFKAPHIASKTHDVVTNRKHHSTFVTLSISRWQEKKGCWKKIRAAWHCSQLRRALRQIWWHSKSPSNPITVRQVNNTGFIDIQRWAHSRDKMQQYGVTVRWKSNIHYRNAAPDTERSHTMLWEWLDGSSQYLLLPLSHWPQFFSLLSCFRKTHFSSIFYLYIRKNK